ncbi:MAG: ABC transporter ATP-binding protein, partial [Methanobrevibacter sp.]|nr:ABC transporter ATP-binding protein [Methanobrevibacter sp.]
MVIDNKLFEVRNISFSYDDEEIFSGISFSIDKGDVLCILGPNGTGKTTLIKCLNGLHDISSGEILINGKNIKKLSFREISTHIGYIPQSHVPSFPFKVIDVVVMGRAPYLNLTDSPKKEDMDIAVNALKTLGIEHLRNKEYTNLSGGERQLVFLARILCQQPDILILDEPTSHLD